MNFKSNKGEINLEYEDLKQLHSDALVIDTLNTKLIRCLPGEGEANINMINDFIRGKTNITNMQEISVQISDLCDKQWLHGKANPWAWWEKSGVDIIHMGLGISAGASEYAAYHKLIKDIARLTLRFDKSDKLVKVTKSDDIIRAKREGKYGVILGTQNLNFLNGDLNNFDLFYYFGLRILQLTYNLRNLAGNGCTERKDEGLSEFGIQAIRKMNDLGILVDLSHCGINTTLEAIEISNSPVAFTHTFCKSIRDHDRAKTDEQLKVLKEHDGFAGILLVPDFLLNNNGKASLDDFLDHIDHTVKILGVERVGIGPDHPFFPSNEIWEIFREKRKKEIKELGVDSLGWRHGHYKDEGLLPFVKGYLDWCDFPNITKGLSLRGYSNEQIKGILGQNFLRIFREVVD
ncbi:hypothetical protein ES705_05201 [subsurface metagenome]